VTTGGSAPVVPVEKPRELAGDGAVGHEHWCDEVGLGVAVI
jgi:hypothetical protein